MSKAYSTLRSSALAELAEGDVRAAFLSLERAFLTIELSEGDFTEALTLLGVVAAKIGGPQFGEKARAAAGGDPNALRALAVELDRADAHPLAARLLERAHTLRPGDLQITMDWVSALESSFENTHAREVLAAIGEPGRSAFVVRYFSAFHAIMCGDLAAASEIDLSGGRADLSESLRGMLARAESVSKVSPLGTDDLRGWQAVIDGSIVLHRSPHGPDVMRGRYAFVQEPLSLAAEGIARVMGVLHALSLLPERVLLLPGDDSEALGRAIATRLGIAAEPYAPELRGLIVADDLERVPFEVTRALAEKRAGQILWAHAASWTRPYPFAADLVTYQYQQRVGPWDANIPDGEADLSPVPEKAAQIAAAKPDSLEDLPMLISLAMALKPSLVRTGQRLPQRRGSPVRSARFS